MRKWLATLLLFWSGCFGKSGEAPLAMTLEAIETDETLVTLQIAPFQREVYPYLQANCALCHGVAVGGAAAFASSDVGESFVASQSLLSWSGDSPEGALVRYASNGHCGTASRCARPAQEWIALLRGWYRSSKSPEPEASPSPLPSPSPQNWSTGRQNRIVALPLAWQTESAMFTAAEFSVQDTRIRLRLEGQRVSPTELRLRNPRLILASGAVTAGDLIVAQGLIRGNGDGDFSQAQREVAGPTPAGGVSLLAASQTISIEMSAAGLELLVSFGALENSACAAIESFTGAALAVVQAQCIGCHQTTFFGARSDAEVCRTLLAFTLPRDATNSQVLTRPQGAFGHPVIGLSTAEQSAIRSWIETEGGLR